MSDITSSYQANQNLKAAKAALRQAKKDKANSATISDLQKKVNTAQAIVDAIERATGGK